MSSESTAVRSLWRALWSCALPSRLLLCISFGCLVLARVAALGVPIIYKRIIDHIGMEPRVHHVLLLLIGAYGLVRLSSTLFNEVRDLFFAPVEQRAIRTLSRAIFAHLHKMDVSFHLNRKTGELTRILERGGRAIENFFRYFVFTLLPTFFELTMIVVVLFYLYAWTFSFVVLVTLFAYIAFTFKISSWRLQFMRRMNKAQNTLGSRMVDSLLNYATVKQFGNEQLEVNRYDTFLATYEKENIYNRQSLALLNFGQAVILTLGIVVVMLVALPSLETGVMNVGDFVLLNTYLLQVYAPLYILGFAYRELKQALVDMEGFFTLLEAKPAIVDAPKTRPFTFKGGEIVFKNVSFSYDAERTLLKNLSFTVPAGSFLAIVGASGSGKSTTVSLLMRFFDPSEGEILIDGQNIATLSQHTLRALIGVVPQDTVLFNDTLAYNIGYGDPEASLTDIQKASKGAALDSFIRSLPEGYDTVVGERGLKLSGGEKQRVAIARAVLKDPKIFIFDEATSSLDTRTEKHIQQSLFSCAKGHTTIMVAHRLSTVVQADAIVVLDKGKLVEQGTHEDLLKKDGAYAKLWRQQELQKTQPDDGDQ
ncbi:ABC transporter ATP-binding protein/permease [bacterium NHP-B]|nr:ABC transporter ATP-binding protein/permease [bacterium NHP-B]